MKKSAYAFFLAFALSCGALALPQTAFAQDEGKRTTLRERIKERWLKRQQEKQTAPEATAAGSEQISKPGDYTFSLVHDGLTRMYRVHVPASYGSATVTPLLVALHGGGGNMDYQANDKYYGLISKSEKEGFIVAFPNGYSKLKSGKFATWNAGGCCGSARDGKVDDAGFIRQMVNKLAGQLNIDRTRIFATGMSNGGMMSYRLACEMPDVFKAIASVAGTDNTTACNPRSPIAILHIHAKDDDHVLFGGGAGAGAFKDESKITNFTSVPDTVSKWVALNHCNPSPKRILDKPDAYCETYSRCQANAEVQLCVTANGGHSWPGGVKPRGDQPASSAISADDVMWDFFKSK
jgi:polyhydroxybutyrate depolymerase